MGADSSRTSSEVFLTWAQVMGWRVSRHHLAARVPRGGMLGVVEDIAGLHAQLTSSAELSLWARVEDLEADAVQQALWSQRSLVKTWAMRGTLHLLPAAEYPLWQAGLSTYRNYLKNAWFRYFDVTRDELEQLLAAVSAALDGRMLTREELADAVSTGTGVAKLGEKVRDNWGALLKPASFRGQLCFAPSQGQNVRFTRPDRWLRMVSTDQVEPKVAMQEIARRFLSAYGPATREDFARWWAMSPAEAQKLLQSLGQELVSVQVEGTTAWMLAEHAAEVTHATAQGSVRLLPAFDPYVIGATRHADKLLPGPFAERIYRPQGWVSPVLLVDGRMDGIWGYEKKRSSIAVHIEPFVALPVSARAAAAREADLLARFLGGPLHLTWTA
jgi:hypothetical protein